MGIERIPPLPDIGYGVTNSGSSRRNLVVNGDMLINQRFPADNSAIASNGSAPQWFMDRWAITAALNNQTVFYKKITGTAPPLLPGFTHCALVAASVGSIVAFPAYYAQAVESAKIQEIAGLPVTLSYWAVCGSTFGSTYWNTVFGTFPANPVIGIVQAGTGINEGTFAAFTGSTYPIVTLPQLSTSWRRFTATGIIPANAQEVKVYFEGNRTTTAYDANAWWAITGVQLEVGTQATPFDKIPFDQSLTECERFYEKSFNYAQAPVANSGTSLGITAYRVQIASTTAGYRISVPFKTRKVNTPTVTAYCPGNIANPQNWWNFSTSTISGLASTANAGESTFDVQNPQVAGDAVGQVVGVHWVASADF